MTAPPLDADEPPFRRLLAEFFESRLATIGLAAFAVLALAALLAPLISPQNPYDLAQLDILDGRLEPGAASQGGTTYWLGTDDQGSRHAERDPLRACASAWWSARSAPSSRC
ncbi:MAG: hypothetical protein WDO24_11845 [Pseudomonadota bacterium]